MATVSGEFIVLAASPINNPDGRDKKGKEEQEGVISQG